MTNTDNSLPPPRTPAHRSGRLSLKLGLILIGVWIVATVVGALIGLLATLAKLALLVCAMVWAVHVFSVMRRPKA